MFTDGENVRMEAGVEMKAPCWEKTNVTLLRINWRHAASSHSQNVWYVVERAQTIVWRSPAEHDGARPVLHLHESHVTAKHRHIGKRDTFALMDFLGYLQIIFQTWHSRSPKWDVPKTRCMKRQTNISRIFLCKTKWGKTSAKTWYGLSNNIFMWNLSHKLVTEWQEKEKKC